MPSLCFYCKNARADLCEKVRRGTPIKGWNATKGFTGGYDVRRCPNFEIDEIVTDNDYIPYRFIAEKLGVSESSVKNMSTELVIGRMKSKGYLVEAKQHKWCGTE